MTESMVPATRPPAMADVAQRAGVSHQTVSRVLNEPEKVRPQTRERVHQAIIELGYRRNVAARALVTRRSNAIGVVVPATGLHGPTATMLSLEHAAREAGYWVSLASLAVPDRATMRGALDHFIEQGVDAIVVIAPTVGVLQAVSDAKASVPVVTVTSASVLGAELETVKVDQRSGARIATEHLLELGHRHIGHISGLLDWFDAEERVAGWREALAAAGLPEGPLACGDWTAQSGYRCARHLLAHLAAAPSALFVANDQMALGALRALEESGLRVPQDVSVVGFDDAPGSGYFAPPLTTIRQDVGALGRRALEAVLTHLAPHPQEPDQTPIAPTLIVRASTAPPPSH